MIEFDLVGGLNVSIKEIDYGSYFEWTIRHDEDVAMTCKFSSSPSGVRDMHEAKRLIYVLYGTQNTRKHYFEAHKVLDKVEQITKQHWGYNHMRNEIKQYGRNMGKSIAGDTLSERAKQAGKSASQKVVLTARREDPQTSHDAAEAATENASDKMKKVVELLSNRPHMLGCHAEEISAFTGIRLNSISTLLSKMVRKNMVRDTGFVTVNPTTKRKVTVYCLPENIIQSRQYMNERPDDYSLAKKRRKANATQSYQDGKRDALLELKQQIMDRHHNKDSWWLSTSKAGYDIVGMIDCAVSDLGDE